MNTEKRRKHVFFLPLMFIGIGIGFLVKEIVAFMFIGIGLGFLLDSLFVIEEKKIKIQRMYKTSSFALMILGFIFVLSGVSYLLSPSLFDIFKDYLISLGFITFGILIFIKGVEGWRSKMVDFK